MQITVQSMTAMPADLIMFLVDCRVPQDSFSIWVFLHQHDLTVEGCESANEDYDDPADYELTAEQIDQVVSDNMDDIQSACIAYRDAILRS